MSWGAYLGNENIEAYRPLNPPQDAAAVGALRLFSRAVLKCSELHFSSALLASRCISLVVSDDRQIDKTTDRQTAFSNSIAAAWAQMTWEWNGYLRVR